MAQFDPPSGSSYPSPDQRLDEFFLRYESSNTVNPTRFSDSDIQQISKLLEETRREWCQVPRTYIVLRIIGMLDLLSDFISLGFNDLWFPVSMNLLPESLSDSARVKFVDVQKVVLTKTIDLEKGEYGKHRSFAGDEDLPFQTTALLGRGGFSEVHKVLSQLSNKEYARKRIRRKMFFGREKNAMKTFLTELEILKRLKHHHIVKLVGSYTVPIFLGLIMSPVADANLSEFLETVPANPDRKSLLQGFFGCLTAALVYLHGKRIRHKDIKPQNILIKGETVLFTDFGISFDWSNMTRSTTEGPTTAFTAKYSAPEVAVYGPRNSSSDVWSLGCVFLEMMTVLKGETIATMGSFLENHGSQASRYCSNLDALSQWIEAIGTAEGFELDNVPFAWIRKMLQLESSSRPTSRDLMELINHNPNFELRKNFCGICCMYDDGSYSDMTSCDDEITGLASSSTDKSIVESSECSEHEMPPAGHAERSDRATHGNNPAKLLLMNGFDMKATDFDRTKALQWAASNGHEMVARLLLSKGASVKAKDSSGDTALHRAAYNGHEMVVQLLLENGADVEAKNSSGETTLYRAASNGQGVVVRLLLERGADVKMKVGKSGESALHQAARCGHEAVVRLLLDAGANVDAKAERSEETALHLASGNGHEAVVRLLLEKNADVEANEKRFGETAIHRAAWMGHEATVRLLLEKGASIDAKEKRIGETALHQAAWKGHERVVQLLLEKGVDAEAKDHHGTTALQQAARRGHDAVIRLFESAIPHK